MVSSHLIPSIHSLSVDKGIPMVVWQFDDCLLVFLERFSSSRSTYNWKLPPPFDQQRPFRHHQSQPQPLLQPLPSNTKFDHGKGKHSGGLARPASVQLALSILEMEVEQINKGNYEHHVQKEIHEQLESLTTTMSSRRIIFIGCATSYNAALAARPILEKFSGRDQYTEKIQLFLLDNLVKLQIRYMHDALEYALENGAPCVGITNTVGSEIARNTHCGVHINAGAEIGKVSEVLKLDQEMKDLGKLLIAE
ncbi:Glutamine--fructose-6-phosphate aminotransferase [isomerizing] [Camellia lanceoleosa]|uniref:Glutamine--fructose-6-phosphate aminotransferase [isomerizing] n=1 Tax=Camellia lanceoleosa TaxID=1840588 RepID=A0ACC0IN95_9ERIC|nr:Glutamine--fructose-6-phosphate aminotransferase [isomerizing] [Camellia lanceoleosa]